ncbi:MAG: hypothetical protein FJZ67_02580 [Bacteroidetes bacterium]|nr:hypothetical protein [Bacteroidota bacterium]
MQLNFNHIFPELPEQSRVWLYLADRKLDSTELLLAEEKLQDFLSTWKAHGKSLNCNGTILFSQYLILSVDEDIESASGCSIDSSVRFVKMLGSELDVDFFNRLNVLSFINENETQTINYFKAISGKNPYLNPLIQTLGELKGNWTVYSDPESAKPLSSD